MPENPAAPTIGEVVTALATAVGLDEADYDLVEIRRATEFSYMCRAYPASGDEFVAYPLTFTP